jgi:hypothetical protein
MHAEGFLGHIVARRLEGPRTAASTESEVFTCPAFSFIGGEIPQPFEDIGLIPDLPETTLLEITAFQFQIATGLNDSDMGNKAEGCPAEAASGDRVEPISFEIHLFAPEMRLLPENSIVMGRTRSF